MTDSTPQGALARFLRLESAGGLLLMAATLLAMLVANSPLAAAYAALLETRVAVGTASVGIAKPLLLWINDGLMAVYFLVVGLELKRELLEGHLASLRQASLPAIAALGGMLAPALIYVIANRHDAAALRGWAIPTATDIAFALGVLALLGKRVPPGLKAFLLSVAIFDDLGAIVVIALFYTAHLSGLSLGIAAVLIVALVALNRAGVTRMLPYLLVGVPLWVAVLKSGVHATLAGVVLAMAIPLRTRDAPGHAPLHRLEHALHPWVTFGILPVFAFANAGVPLAGMTPADLLHPVPAGIALALFVGKKTGVLASCWLAVRLGLAALPAGVGWRQLHGVSMLCGIGFTMSLFIASLAFEQGGPAFDGLERLGILIGSLVSGVCGYLALRAAPTPVSPRL